MSYAEHWADLSAQIRSLQRAGGLYALFQSYHNEDSYGAGQYLREQCGNLVQSLRDFRRDFNDSLPQQLGSTTSWELLWPKQRTISQLHSAVLEEPW